jgi:hypothetical protein
MIESFGGPDETQNAGAVQIVPIDRRRKTGRNEANHSIDNGHVLEDQSVALFRFAAARLA